MACDISSTPKRETLAAPASRFTYSVRSWVLAPQMAIDVETVSAACARFVPPAAASVAAASAAPPMMSRAEMPFAARISMALAASVAPNIVSLPMRLASSPSPLSSSLVACETAPTEDMVFSKSAATLMLPVSPLTAVLKAFIATSAARIPPAISLMPASAFEESAVINTRTSLAIRGILRKLESDGTDR